jgi:hypothetical protein
VGTDGQNAIKHVVETNGERTKGSRKSGTGAGKLAEHRMRPNNFLFLALEGGEKTRLSSDGRSNYYLGHGCA